MKLSLTINKIAKSVKEEYSVTDYEALTIALKIEENELFRKAHVISSDNKNPTALEKIAIELENKL